MKEGWFEGVDGTKLYYRTVGKGIPLILNDGIGCAGYVWRYLIPYFEDRYMVVHWHYMGHGRSDMPKSFDNVSTADLASNLAKLCDFLKLPPAVLIGHSMGVQVIFEFAKLFPEKCAGLVPITGSYGKPLDTFHDNSLLKTVFPAIKNLIHTNPQVAQTLWTAITNSELAYRVATRFEVNGRLVKREDFKPYFEHIAKVDVKLFTEMLSQAQLHTAKPDLGNIKVPTLIIGGEKDTFTPMWLSIEMQRLIPDSEMQMVPEGSHTVPIEMPDLTNLRIEKFLREKIEKPIKPKKKATKKAAPKKTAAKKKKPATAKKAKKTAKKTVAKKK